MGTFNSQNHIASFDDREGNTAEIYKRGSGYYGVVSGDLDYDFSADSLEQLKSKLDGWGFKSEPFAGQLENKGNEPMKELIESEQSAEEIVDDLTEASGYQVTITFDSGQDSMVPEYKDKFTDYPGEVNVEVTNKGGNKQMIATFQDERSAHLLVSDAEDDGLTTNFKKV